MRSIRELGYQIGTLPTGTRNAISDVVGVTVGHCTLSHGDCRTGVTVILPAQDNLFANKLTAACHVHNGFGKTCGLMQIDELGTIETPIALTNTLNVGLVHDALVSYTLDRCEEDGIFLRSVNPVVGECNDGKLSRIALRPVSRAHVFEAIRSAASDFPQGSVGAGTGTVCYGLKGGIGTASRIIRIDDQKYTVGVLVQSNFGSTEDLTIAGAPIGKDLIPHLESRKILPARVDAGSIMMILATDLPVDHRQLGRIIRRCSIGLARTGSYLGHGSGEVMIGFTTKNRIPHEGCSLLAQHILREDLLDLPFRAAAEATEEAVLNSMTHAETTQGYTGDIIYSLREFL